MKKQAFPIRLLALLAIIFVMFAGSSLIYSRAGANDGRLKARDEGLFYRAERPVPGQYIVVLNETDDVDGVARRLAAEQGGTLNHIYRTAIKGFAIQASEQAAIAISKNPLVKYVEEDAVVEAVGSQSNATWGLDRVDQRNLPMDTVYNYNATGLGVNVYIVDTGIRVTHQDFGGRASIGFDAIGDGRNGSDCNGHGTHVAGTAAGTTYGVAKSANIIAVRVLNCQGSGTISGVVAGVDWVTANHIKPAVANMSLGGGASSTLDSAVANSVAAGVTYVVAAGNSAADACNASPARVRSALTIGASDRLDQEASFSNFGSCVDLLAPGVSITSAWFGSDTQINTISGTSMASPHVAGAVALYLEANRTATASEVETAIESNATPNKITSMASSLTPNLLLYTLNFASGGGGGGGNTAPTASFTFTTSDLTASFNGSGSSDSDGSITSYAWNFGDGTTGSGVTVSHSYAAAGTYTVTLTVTDNAGATGSQSQSVTVTAAPPTTGISLTASGYKVKGQQKADLRWSGATSTNMDIFRNGVRITTTANDGFYTDNINQKGGGSYTYKVCEAGTGNCSNESRVVF